jgi:heme/copper-type cytochrome/quinol oxidase subunit 2
MKAASAVRWTAFVLGVALGITAALAQEEGRLSASSRRPEQAEGREARFSVSAHKYAFAPALLEVQQDDLVRVTLTSSDIPHSFTIDKYRIAKRVEPGKTVVFEFRADQPGRFPIYCNLTLDEKCKEMHGELVVKGRN